MDIIRKLLGDKFHDLTQSLVNSGFSTAEAEKFIPVAAKDAVSAYQDNKENVDTTNISETAQTLLSSINLNDLAVKAGVSPELATKGLTSIMPILLQLAEQHKDKLSMLSGFGNSNLGNMLGGFAGKFLGK